MDYLGGSVMEVVSRMGLEFEREVEVDDWGLIVIST